MNTAMATIPMYTPTREYNNHKDEYDSAINDILTSGAFINGPQIQQLEKKLAEYVGSNYCITTANGTDSLLVALLALDVKPGDEVITVAHTWISSSEVISLIGAVPVFIDIDPETFIMDLNLIESHITAKTVGILPVNLYGNMVDIDLISQIAKRNKLWIIEDAAQSFGSSLTLNHKTYKSGYWSTIGCTSFFPSKPLGAFGDAGACFTNDKELALKLTAIKNHGGLARFNHQYIGLNARMDTIQAAVLLVKLKYFDPAIKRRQEIADYYTNKLSNIKGIATPKYIDGLECAWAQYSLLVTNNNINNNNSDNISRRDTIVQKMKDKGIQISIFYPKGLHEQACFAYLNTGELPKTDYVCSNILNIPLFPELTQSELEYITNTLIDVVSI
jgi:UDP-2-acetamido-2-deoxy-ribo-hexuluronate aminotransferase